MERAPRPGARWQSRGRDRRQQRARLADRGNAGRQGRDGRDGLPRCHARRAGRRCDPPIPSRRPGRSRAARPRRSRVDPALRRRRLRPPRPRRHPLQQRRRDVPAAATHARRLRDAVRHQSPRPFRVDRASAARAARRAARAGRDDVERLQPRRPDPRRRPAGRAPLQPLSRLLRQQAREPRVRDRTAAPLPARGVRGHQRRRASRLRSDQSAVRGPRDGQFAHARRVDARGEPLSRATGRPGRTSRDSRGDVARPHRRLVHRTVRMVRVAGPAGAGERAARGARCGDRRAAVGSLRSRDGRAFPELGHGRGSPARHAVRPGDRGALIHAQFSSTFAMLITLAEMKAW
ncbi:hypothetical protein BDI4_670070 [Burkholderia diffusa]|nr:hypothetical protein BDI4_670070 [Burkholderia diffusa]